MDRVLRIANPGTLNVGDNVLHRGQVADAYHNDACTYSIRHFNQRMASDSKVGIDQFPVGDGLSICRVKREKYILYLIHLILTEGT
ncbi:hypothetical protein HUW50_23280 [Metabacillus sp. KUDC1714]|uniref:Uncharacterized protein n=1 Tax=Metabacillus elymi TaxID=2745198 RepID=A0ABX6SBJ2_9BACI|nr:hypothetical protein HUW50_23280 [Metabacillus sp. KUDC1714]